MPDHPKNHPAASAASTEARYEELLHRLCAHAQTVGIRLRPSRDETLFFRALPAAMQQRVVGDLDAYAAVCAEVVSGGKSLLDDRHMLWRMLVRRRLTPVSDLFTQIEDDDMLEIYDVSGWVQIYRSLNFFRVCSYTLDEILCRPWFELYHRDPAVTEQILATAVRVLEVEAPGLVHYEIPPHVLEETEGTERLKWLSQQRFVSRLVDETGQVSAVVNVIRALRRLDPGL